MVRRKRQPQRTCIGCRQVGNKRELIRIVRTPQGEIHLDPTGKRSGRGAYLCPNERCLQQALASKQLAAAFRTEVRADQVEHLRQELQAYLEIRVEP